MGIMDDKNKLGAMSCFGIGLILGIVGAASNTMYVLGDSDNGQGAGIWASTITIQGTSVSTDNECNAADSPGARDCASGLDSKCMTNKAFIILGILANAAALGLVVSGAGPAIAAPAAGAFAALSYMIVWAIFAGQMNAAAEDCGYDNAEGVDYGAAFGCTIVAWLVCIAGAGASFMAGQAA